MSEYHHMKEDITENGYAEVDIDLDRRDLETAIREYQEFLRTDESQHAASRYVMDERGDDDFGQYRRIAGQQSARGPMPDNKDIFHFGVHTTSMLGARFGRDLAPETRRFLTSATEIFEAVQRAKKRTLRELDRHENGFAWALCPPADKVNDVLRFVVYYGNDDTYLAHGHYDRSVTTMAVGESHAGLRIAPGQNGLVRDADLEYMDALERSATAVKYRPRVAKFFLGAGWNRLPRSYRASNLRLPLGWHDVTATDETVDDTVKRWAIVGFNNPYRGMPDYTVPTPPETRPYKRLGKLSVEDAVVA